MSNGGKTNLNFTFEIILVFPLEFLLDIWRAEHLLLLLKLSIAEKKRATKILNIVAL